MATSCTGEDLYGAACGFRIVFGHFEEVFRNFQPACKVLDHATGHFAIGDVPAARCELWLVIFAAGILDILMRDGSMD